MGFFIGQKTEGDTLRVGDVEVKREGPRSQSGLSKMLFGTEAQREYARERRQEEARAKQIKNEQVKAQAEGKKAGRLQALKEAAQAAKSRAFSTMERLAPNKAPAQIKQKVEKAEATRPSVRSYEGYDAARNKSNAVEYINKQTQKTAFVDQGNKITINDPSSAASVKAAMQHAAERNKNQLQISGNAEFKKSAAAAAYSLGCQDRINGIPPDVMAEAKKAHEQERQASQVKQQNEARSQQNRPELLVNREARTKQAEQEKSAKAPDKKLEPEKAAKAPESQTVQPKAAEPEKTAAKPEAGSRQFDEGTYPIDGNSNGNRMNAAGEVFVNQQRTPDQKEQWVKDEVETGRLAKRKDYSVLIEQQGGRLENGKAVSMDTLKAERQAFLEKQNGKSPDKQATAQPEKAVQTPEKQNKPDLTRAKQAETEREQQPKQNGRDWKSEIKAATKSDVAQAKSEMDQAKANDREKGGSRHQRAVESEFKERSTQLQGRADALSDSVNKSAAGRDASIIHSTGEPDARVRLEKQLGAQQWSHTERQTAFQEAAKNEKFPSVALRYEEKAEQAGADRQKVIDAREQWKSQGMPTDPEAVRQVREKAGFKPEENTRLMQADRSHKEADQKQQSAPEKTEKPENTQKAERPEIKEQYQAEHDRVKEEKNHAMNDYSNEYK